MWAVHKPNKSVSFASMPDLRVMLCQCRVILNKSFLPALGIVFVAILLEISSRLELVPSREFPPISTVLVGLVAEMRCQEFWVSFIGTLQGWAGGLALGVAIAIPAGIVLGASDLVFRALRLVIESLRPIPTVALIPLAILVIGIGQGTKIALVAFAVFWPMLIQTIYGVRDVDPVARSCMQSFQISRRYQVYYLVLPSAAPYILTGLRLASSVALIVAVATELVVGMPGLGASISAAQISGEPVVQYGYLLATGILGLVLNLVFLKIERKLLFWHPSQRGGAP